MRRIIIVLILFINGVVNAQTSFNLNDRVEAEDKGKWYKATIVRAKGGQHFKDGKYFIHWDGYAASYDVWIEESKLRKPVTASTSSNSTNVTSNNAAPQETSSATNTKYKVGDKIMFQGYGGNFPTGTITKYKDGWYYVDVTDGSDKQVGLNGMRETSIFPVWQYKAFFEELNAISKTTSMVSILAKLVCGDCASAQLTYGYQLEDINKAKIAYAQLKELVKKYEPLPETGKNYFTSNPALVGKVSSKSDSIIASMLSDNIKERMRFWFEADMYFYDFTYEINSTDHVLFNGKSFADFAVCGSLADLKEGLKKNLAEVIKKNGLSGLPDDYLKGFDENFEKRKAKLFAEANENAWVKSDYPYLDNSTNALVANANLKTVNTYFNSTTYSVKRDDLNLITEQTKGGVVIYQKPGCDYWMWQYITAYKPYLGNGKYGAVKMRFFDYGFIKPF